MTPLGPLLRKARHAAGFTLGQAAQASGLSACHIRAIERGRRKGSLAVLCRLAVAYGRRASDLLKEAGA